RLHRTHPELTDPANVASIVIHTSHHTHYVIGSGANDPQKYDPHATRETLDHAIPYIVAVAPQAGDPHHQRSDTPQRPQRAGAVANDPQKYDPTATRNTLHPTIPFSVAAARREGDCHHQGSYSPARAHRPDSVKLWRNITTAEDPA